MKVITSSCGTSFSSQLFFACIFKHFICWGVSLVGFPWLEGSLSLRQRIPVLIGSSSDDIRLQGGWIPRLGISMPSLLWVEWELWGCEMSTKCTVKFNHNSSLRTYFWVLQQTNVCCCLGRVWYFYSWQTRWMKFPCLTVASMTGLLVKVTLNFGHHQRADADDIHVETLSQHQKSLAMSGSFKCTSLCWDNTSKLGNDSGIFLWQ
jgi:hypothetical protein